jgi:hypothetical protein
MCTRVSELVRRVCLERTAPLSYAQMNRVCVAIKSPASDAIGKEIRA